MVVEGKSYFFSMNKKEDWQKSSVSNLEWSDQGVELAKTHDLAIDYKMQMSERLRAVITSQHASGSDEDPIFAIRDFSLARTNVLVWLDERGHVVLHDENNHYQETLFQGEGHLAYKHAFILANEDMMILIHYTPEMKIAAFSLLNGQCIWTVNDWNGRHLYPLAAALDTNGVLHVVTPFLPDTADVRDNLPKETELHVCSFDHAGRPLAYHVHPELLLHEPRELATASRRALVQMSTTHSGKLFIFLKERRTVIQISEDGSQAIRLTLPIEVVPTGFAVDANEILYLGDGRQSGSTHAHSRFLYRFLPSGEAIAPVAAYSGHADKLIFDRHNRLYVWDEENAVLTRLRFVQQRAVQSTSGLHKGVMITQSFDSSQSETIWHKFTLDAEIPDETQLLLSYFAADRKEHLIQGKWCDLDDFLSDPSASMQEKLSATADLWSEPVINAADALFLSAQGRYLWIKMELHGTKQTSPIIQRLRVFAPRQSFTAYLPAVFQEDAASAPFLERFLALFETFYLDVEQRIDTISRYFDPDLTPRDFVPWLSSWLGQEQDDMWSEDQRRELIRRAPEMYAERGTRMGLEKMIQLYTGEKPIIVEYFQVREMLQHPELKALIAGLYTDNPYRFSVLVSHHCVRTERDRMSLQKILDDQTPAFTEGKLVVLQAGIYADLHSYVGINSYLMEPALLTLDQHLSIPYSTVISGKEDSQRMDDQLRLGSATTLE